MKPQEWAHIRKVIAQAQKASMHCSIATVDKDLQPTITPIGTLFLHDTSARGFFFDSFSEALQANLSHHPKACIQAINSSSLFWLQSLFKGQFKDFPGIRLYVEIGDLRPANEAELALVNRRIRALKRTKGSKLIWNDFKNVRDFQVYGYKWVKYPYMMPAESF